MLPLIFIFVLGLIVGSFIGALSYRLPKGVNIASGRSSCPKCKNKISWYDNIPVISYLILLGKCRSCRRKISLRYPLIEIGTAIIFVLIGPNVLLLAVSCLLIAILVIDLEHMIIPDELVFWGLFLFIVVSLFTNPYSLFPNLLAGFASALVLLLIHLVTRGRGMGLGDVKLAILLGAVLGPSLSPAFFLASFLTGGSVATILLISGRAKLKQKIAFGPFLVVGFFIAQLLGRNLAWFGQQTLQLSLF